jgi:4-amino-4-deoxy-L-arabinose transferase-like glycosyltransferase
MTSLKKYSAYLWIAAFVLGDIALFSSRAVYLDEPFFLALAHSPRNHWLFFEDSQRVIFGLLYPVFGGGSHPPAVVYYLSALFSLLGHFSEIPFRLLYSIFGLAAAFGLYGLARQRCASPLGVTLLFAASPAFFLMSQTLMMDVPMLGFLLLGLHFYFDPIDGRPPRLILAGICFSLSALTGYTALVPLACLFVSALLTQQSRSRLATVAVAPCFLAIWLVLMLLYYHKDPLTPVIRYFAAYRSPAHNILATPSFLGGVTVFPWLFLMMLRKGKETGTLLVIASFAVATALSFFIDWKSFGYGLWFILLASSGTALLLLFASEAVRTVRNKWTPLELFIVMWFPATVFFFILVAQFISARYLLLAMPSLYLLLFNRSTSRSLVAVFVPTLIVSLLVAIADYRFVNTYPAWVSANIKPLQARGFRILGAAESGLRFYLEELGVPTLATSDLRPTGGDLIVRHSTIFKYSLSEHVETMLIVLGSYELNDALPLRTFCQEAGAGFHGSTVGIVPFAFSRAPHDRLEISEMSPLVQNLPQVSSAGKPVPVWSPNGPILVQNEPELSFPLTLPKQTRIQYEIEGSGIVEMKDGYVKLRKSGTGPTVWRNFRIVPEQ